MKKLRNWICGIVATVVMLYLFVSFWQHAWLEENLIRLHVIAASDSDSDQALKLQVRDQVLTYLSELPDQPESRKEAQEILQREQLAICQEAEKILTAAGCGDSVSVLLGEERYPVRHYDTFSLPSGVYYSLRIVIGEGEGKNWRCVAFPQLCMPENGMDFETAAAAGGFPETLSQTLVSSEQPQISFFLLDWIGRLEILLRDL